MLTKTILRSAAAAALLGGVVAPAQAAFIFTLTGNSATDGADGNTRTFVAIGTGADAGQTINLRVTAWSLVSGKLEDAYLGAYAQGLGVTSDAENGSNTTHIVDNSYGKDFLLFQFDKAVDITSATFNVFTLNGNTDSDATIGVGNLAWGSTPSDGTTLSTLLTGNTWSSAGTSTSGSRDIDPNKTSSGSLWLIGADFDQSNDGFKLSSLTVKPTGAVPEPATWAMMITGFGAVGTSMRRRRKSEALAAA